RRPAGAIRTRCARPGLVASAAAHHASLPRGAGCGRGRERAPQRRLREGHPRTMNVLDRFRLDGRRALVTGGARGLGRVMAEALAQAGADVAITSRDPAASEEAARAIAGATGRRTHGGVVDVAS